MTTFVLPRADRPAVRAKGTVSPSESPIMASDITRGFIRDDLDEEEDRIVDCIEDPSSLYLSGPAVLSISMVVDGGPEHDVESEVGSVPYDLSTGPMMCRLKSLFVVQVSCRSWSIATRTFSYFIHISKSGRDRQPIIGTGKVSRFSSQTQIL